MLVTQPIGPTQCDLNKKTATIDKNDIDYSWLQSLTTCGVGKIQVRLQMNFAGLTAIVMS